MMEFDKLPLNELARELHRLQEEHKIREKRIDAIKDMFKAKGSFSTKDFIISVRELKREMVGPSTQVITVIGKDKLDELGLIYNQTYLIVNVMPKGLPQGFL